MYCGYIATIKEIHKHSNADRLQCATIYGSNVIVDLSYYIGQRVVYFPVDGQLSEEFANDNNLVRKKDENGNNIGGYLNPDKRNITALKLRGEKSDGLVLPIETLSKYVDVSKLKDGDEITVLNGHNICQKYIPQRNQCEQHTKGYPKAKNKKEEKEIVAYPYFAEHKDTAQLAYNEEAFHEGDTIYITTKCHGTSGRTSRTLEITTRGYPKWVKKILHKSNKVTSKYNVISGTRRVVLRNYDGGFYGNNAFRKKYHDYFAEKLPKGMTVYYEIVGWITENTPIMPSCNNSLVKDKAFKKMYGETTTFTYGCKPGESDIYVYRITITNEDGVVFELPTEDTIVWCERLGVKYVPLLEKFIFTTWDDLNKRCEKYLDVPEPLSNNTHIREGVVVRIDNRPTFSAYKTKSFGFKVLEGIIKDTSDSLDIEEAQEFLET